MDPCKYEKEIGALIESSKNFKDFMHEVRDNHLHSIYEELKSIRARMAIYRPPWSMVFILSGLMTLLGVIATAFIMK